MFIADRYVYLMRRLDQNMVILSDNKVLLGVINFYTRQNSTTALMLRICENLNFNATDWETVSSSPLYRDDSLCNACMVATFTQIVIRKTLIVMIGHP